MTVPAPADDLPKLEKFELLEEIGHGGMATVYRALDPRLGREVAVKIIHRHLRDNPEVATRFVAEARAAAKLKHRGIVEVYDVSSEDDREKYLVVELIRGCTLRKTLVDDREMPAEIAAAIVAELCEAVEHAHAAGIIHRDIKPENVLVEIDGEQARAALRRSERNDADLEAKSGATLTRTDAANDGESLDAEEEGSAVSAKPSSADGNGDRGPSRRNARASSKSGERKAESPKSDDGRSSDPSRGPKSARPPRVSIKLTDFGIAKVLDAQGVTSTGQVLGSPAHMAPEQIDGGEIDTRTDVFALGVLLYECLVGHLPFEGKNPAQVLRRVIEGTFSPADLERPTVGGRYARIVAQALATSPSDRFETPQALADELRKEMGEVGLVNGRDEIAAYFADAEGYREALPGRIVPKLVARGEAARKSRNVQVAASDFNRAHALCPEDPAILKRLTHLSSSTGREKLLRRGAMVAAGAVVLAAATYGVVRQVRIYTATLNPTGTASNPVDSQPSPLPLEMVNDASPSSVPRIKASAVVATHSAPRSGDTGPAPVAAGEKRDVRFGVSPLGMRVEIDGTPLDVNGSSYPMTPGDHSAVIKPPDGTSCCEQTTQTFKVVAQGKGEPPTAQFVSLAGKIKPASVHLVGAPAGGKVACGAFTITAATLQVNLSTPEFSNQCRFEFVDGKDPIKHRVTLQAGQPTTISWPNGG